MNTQKIKLGKLRFRLFALLLIVNLVAIKLTAQQRTYFGHEVPLKTSTAHPLRVLLVFAELVFPCAPNGTNDWTR